ncbi:MAG: Transcriptional regulator, LysR family [Proteobacteria bacterium]|nr:Transcriptional regulator, LysR family [Pseudomonadota bacterium]
MSVSGVSKQVAGLEAFVGKLLLKKNGRGVQLTTAGREYWKKISQGLRMIETATTEVRAYEGNSSILVLASVPTFLSKWLIPRLPDFRLTCPHVTLVFKEHVGLNSAFPVDVDAVISHGLGNWPNITAEYIAGQEFVCIYAPSLLKRGDAIRKPKDLVAHTLLHLEDAPLAWWEWGCDYGLGEEETQQGPRFTQYSAVIQAVMSGLGVALVPRVLVTTQLQEGRVLVFSSFCYERQGHYLCFRPDKLERPVLSAFRSWLHEQKETDVEKRP